ncbi:MAG: hypothetical protein K5987_00265 [Lachnospiraceae bacterium]|nr:hypothetical protein [Lachnospiraceae bacterium]
MKKKRNKKQKDINSAKAVKEQEIKIVPGHCPRCDVILFDGSTACPLCHCVPEELDKDEEQKAYAVFGHGAPYPDVHKKIKALKLVLRIILFSMILISALLMFLNYKLTPQFKWCYIVIAAFAYCYIMLNYWMRTDSGFAGKAGLQLFASVAIVYAADVATGCHGWAVQWAIPGLILLGDGVVLFLMILNRGRWNSYILLLLLMTLLSGGVLAFNAAGMIENSILAFISVAVTFLFLTGTILLGQGKFSTEIKRRFHV